MIALLMDVFQPATVLRGRRCRSSLAVASVGLVGVCAFHAPVVAADCIGYADYLHWDGSVDVRGPARDVAVAGTYAYVADDVYGLQVIDLAGPTGPAIVGNLPTPSCAVVALAGVYAYVGGGGGSGLTVINIADPRLPRSEAWVDTEGTLSGVAVSGTHIYTVGYSSLLHVIDIRDPSVPAVRGRCVLPGVPNSLVVADNLAYVAAGESGLVVVDVEESTNPVTVGSVNTPGTARDVVVSGTRAYVAGVGGDAGLQVISIATPESLWVERHVDMPGIASGVAVSGNYVFVACDTGGLQVVDFANPENPQFVGSLDARTATGVTVSGVRAYVVDYLDGLKIADITNPRSPAPLGIADTPGQARGVAVAGTMAYVADDYGWFRAVDVESPRSLHVDGSLYVGDILHGVAVADTIAYVANGSAGLTLINIATPASPTRMRVVDTPGEARRVAVSGSYAYVADGPSGLQVVDISRPAISTITGSAAVGDQACGVAVSGRYAYVAGGGLGLHVIDVTEPSRPVTVSSTDTPGFAWSVSISGSYAYVADSDSLQVIDVAVPQHPQVVGSVFCGNAVDVVVSGSYGYVACQGRGGLQVIDVSDADAPRIVGHLPVSEGWSVAVSGEVVYVASGMIGLLVAPAQCAVSSTGACCRPDGTCSVAQQTSCGTPGVWRGAGTPCEPNPCPQPDGRPQVTHVVAVQRSGTTIVDVTYDLADADSHAVTVTLRMSEDGGVRFPIECRSVTGDVGAGVLSGERRRIAWDAGADYPGHVGATYAPRVCADDGQVPAGMVWIPPGNVRLGQTGIAEPVNDVFVNGFYIDRYEVSNSRYKEFIEAGGYTTEAYWNPVGWAWRVANSITLPLNWNSNTYHGGGIAENGEFPVNGVSWFEADAYCRWAGGRLPTEAEWEKAAKGGCETHGDTLQCEVSDTPTYPWGEGFSGARANYAGSGDPYESSGYTTPVAYYDGTNYGGYQTIDSPSPYGLYDVVGNVFEWSSTKLAAYPYSPDDGREDSPVSYNEWGRVLRGGSCDSYGYGLQSADRYCDYPCYRYYYFGFRCVRTGL